MFSTPICHFIFLAIGNNHHANQVFTNNFKVTIIAAGSAHIKSRKLFQNHEYIHTFKVLKKVRSMNSEVLKERRLYPSKNKNEYTQKQTSSCNGVVYIKK